MEIDAGGFLDLTPVCRFHGLAGHTDRIVVWHLRVVGGDGNRQVSKLAKGSRIETDAFGRLLHSCRRCQNKSRLFDSDRDIERR